MRVLPVMDHETGLFMLEIEHEPWVAITELLPESLYDLDTLTRFRPIVYAVIAAFTWSLDNSLGLIGRWSRSTGALHRGVISIWRLHKNSA
jgi:hypothetical protein